MLFPSHDTRILEAFSFCSVSAARPSKPLNTVNNVVNYCSKLSNRTVLSLPIPGLGSCECGQNRCWSKEAERMETESGRNES